LISSLAEKQYLFFFKVKQYIYHVCIFDEFHLQLKSSLSWNINSFIEFVNWEILYHLVCFNIFLQSSIFNYRWIFIFTSLNGINIYCSKFSPSFRHLRLQVKWRELNNIYLRFASENFRMQNRNSQDKMSRTKIQLKFCILTKHIGQKVTT
jgi:hypothetical protein